MDNIKLNNFKTEGKGNGKYVMDGIHQDIKCKDLIIDGIIFKLGCTITLTYLTDEREYYNPSYKLMFGAITTRAEERESTTYIGYYLKSNDNGIDLSVLIEGLMKGKYHEKSGHHFITINT